MSEGIAFGHFYAFGSGVFCFRFNSATAKSTQSTPAALISVMDSWNTKIPTKVATTGSTEARMDAFPVSSPVSPYV